MNSTLSCAYKLPDLALSSFVQSSDWILVEENVFFLAIGHEM